MSDDEDDESVAPEPDRPPGSAAGGSRLSTTPKPSSGGIGSRLKIASETFTTTESAATRRSGKSASVSRRDERTQEEDDAREDDREEQVRERAGRRDQEVRPPRVRNSAERDRDGLRPPEDGQAREGEDRREEEAPDRVEVLQRVHRDPAQVARRVVAAPDRHPAVRRLVKRDGEQKDDDLDDDFERFLGVHGASARGGFQAARRRGC